MPTAPLLDRFPLVHARSVDEMCAALARVYAEPKVRLESAATAIDARLNLYRSQSLAFGYTKYGVALNMAYPASVFLMQSFPLRGAGEATVNGTANPLDQHQGVAISPGMSFSTRVDASYEHLVVLMDVDVLACKLAAMTGATVRCALQFHPIRSDAQPLTRVLRDHVLFVVDKISKSASPLPPILLAEFEQTLMVMSLQANQHNYSHLFQRPIPEVALSKVRLAEDHIEANWRAPLTVEDLAQVTGVSAFSLFRAFKRLRGYTPRQFANRLRLHRARELLRSSQAPTTVAEVAATCGFADVHRFAHDYFCEFGERPVHTLAAAES